MCTIRFIIIFTVVILAHFNNVKSIFHLRKKMDYLHLTTISTTSRTTKQPSSYPTSEPSEGPTSVPSNLPTNIPSSVPTSRFMLKCPHSTSRPHLLQI